VQGDRAPEVVLRVSASEAFLPLAMAFVEKATLGLGLGSSEALALMLATEEVFAHLYRVALPQGGGVELRCSGGGYYVRTDFSFPAADLNLRAFNLTSTPAFDDETRWGEVGLFLAARTVDRFRVSRERGQGLKLTLYKDKEYPVRQEHPPVAAKPLKEFSVAAPSPGELKLFAHQVRACGRNRLLPGFFEHPGKLVDMVQGGEFHAAVARGAEGDLGGGILWDASGGKTVECFGPYRFSADQPPAMAQALLDACLGAIARSRAIGLVNRFPSCDLPEAQFEALGSWPLRERDGTVAALTTWYRSLHEDSGSVVWVHPQLQDFLQEQVRRLVLPRDLRPVKNEGESLPDHSVLAAEIERSRDQVILRPIWPGRDIAVNLADHLRLFEQEDLRNLLFELDLGRTWQADFVPAAFECGFVPRVLLPHGGDGDVVVFHRESLP
jgi:anti-sigma regulatory factor (Ser/Thr protein kinase)